MVKSVLFICFSIFITSCNNNDGDSPREGEVGLRYNFLTTSTNLLAEKVHVANILPYFYNHHDVTYVEAGATRFGNDLRIKYVPSPSTSSVYSYYKSILDGKVYETLFGKPRQGEPKLNSFFKYKVSGKTQPQNYEFLFTDNEQNIETFKARYFLTSGRSSNISEKTTFAYQASKDSNVKIGLVDNKRIVLVGSEINLKRPSILTTIFNDTLVMQSSTSLSPYTYELILDFYSIQKGELIRSLKSNVSYDNRAAFVAYGKYMLTKKDNMYNVLNLSSLKACQISPIINSSEKVLGLNSITRMRPTTVNNQLPVGGVYIQDTASRKVFRNVIYNLDNCNMLFETRAPKNYRFFTLNAGATHLSKSGNSYVISDFWKEDVAHNRKTVKAVVYDLRGNVIGDFNDTFSTSVNGGTNDFTLFRTGFNSDGRATRWEKLVIKNQNP